MGHLGAQIHSLKIWTKTAVGYINQDLQTEGVDEELFLGEEFSYEKGIQLVLNGLACSPKVSKLRSGEAVGDGDENLRGDSVEVAFCRGRHFVMCLTGPKLSSFPETRMVSLFIAHDDE